MPWRWERCRRHARTPRRIARPIALRRGAGSRGCSIVAGDEIAGVVELRPADPNAPVWLHLVAGPPPLSTELLAALIRYLVDERGYHRVAARTAADDATAIQIYEDAGFRRVGVLRQARRDDAGEWRDALFMELVDVR